MKKEKEKEDDNVVMFSTIIDLLIRVNALENFLISKNLLNQDELLEYIEKSSKAITDTLTNNSKKIAKPTTVNLNSKKVK